MRLRLALVAALGAMMYIIARWIPSGGAYDLSWPHCAAQALTAGMAPYETCRIIWQGVVYPSNPLTTALFLWPLSWFSPLPVALIAAGLMTGLAVWGMLRYGEYWRLLALISAPTLLSLWWMNWPLLIFATWYVPWLWPIALLIKPHTALPVALLRWQRWPFGIVIVVAIGLLSLIIRPTWPIEWLNNLGGYTGSFPIIALYGLPLFALLRWRDERAQLLLLCSIFPHRDIYDLLILMVVPRTRAERSFLYPSHGLRSFSHYLVG